MTVRWQLPELPVQLLIATEQCQPPPNAKELAHYTNVNGSICLNYTCYHADVNTGQTCFLDVTRYEGTSDNGQLFYYLVSRDK